jgi:hypothetical protein
MSSLFAVESQQHHHLQPFRLCAQANSVSWLQSPLIDQIRKQYLKTLVIKVCPGIMMKIRLAIHQTEVRLLQTDKKLKVDSFELIRVQSQFGPIHVKNMSTAFPYPQSKESFLFKQKDSNYGELKSKNPQLKITKYRQITMTLKTVNQNLPGVRACRTCYQESYESHCSNSSVCSCWRQTVQTGRPL